MPPLNLTGDATVRRLRWVMLGTMLFSAINTLIGQPDSFWSHPATAIRGDGLSIVAQTNHTFALFLGLGWKAYLLACAGYFSAAFLAVSLLPRRVALTAIFSGIFAHYFGASNWLAVHWHGGMTSPSTYGIVLGAIVALTAFPATADRAPAIRKLRWVMVVTILLDLTFTLIGQPASYWQHPETMHEANALSRFFLGYGWWAFFLYDLVYANVAFLLATRLPPMSAMICAFAFIFGHFNGVSCWFYYEWVLGMAAPVIYGIMLSGIIVLLAFPNTRQPAG